MQVFPWYRFAARIALAAGLVAPAAYLGLLLAMTVHEVLGHGLAALAMDGRFEGFGIALNGAGGSVAYLDYDSPAWQLVVLHSSGTVAGLLAGILLMAVSRRRSTLPSLLLRVFAVCLLFAQAISLWHGARNPNHPTDLSATLFEAGVKRLQPVLYIAGAMVVATVWAGSALVFRPLEGWLGTDGRLSGIRRAVALGLPGIIFLVFLVLMQPDWLVLLAYVVAAASLYWIRLSPRPVPLRHKQLAAALAGVWMATAAAGAATAIWLQHGVRWGCTPMVHVGSLAVSPSGEEVAVLVWHSAGRSHGEGPVRTQLQVVSLPTSSARVVAWDVRRAWPSLAWDPTGRKLVCLSSPPAEPSGPWKVLEIGLANGEVLELAGPSSYSAPKYSPDGRAIGYIETTGDLEGHYCKKLWCVDRASNHREVIAEDVAEWCWGGNSQQIVFIRGGSVVLKDIVDGQEQNLFSAEGDPVPLCLLTRSPDGEAYGFYDGQSFYARDRSGKGRFLSFDCNPLPSGFDWGEGGICYVEANASGGYHFGLMLFDTRTGQVRELTKGPFAFARWLDNEHIIVACFGGLVRLYDVNNEEYVVPAWSPDNAAIDAPPPPE